MKIAKHKIGTHLAETMQPTACLMSNLTWNSQLSAR